MPAATAAFFLISRSLRSLESLPSAPTLAPLAAEPQTPVTTTVNRRAPRLAPRGAGAAPPGGDLAGLPCRRAALSPPRRRGVDWPLRARDPLRAPGPTCGRSRASRPPPIAYVLESSVRMGGCAAVAKRLCPGNGAATNSRGFRGSFGWRHGGMDFRRPRVPVAGDEHSQHAVRARDGVLRSGSLRSGKLLASDWQGRHGTMQAWQCERAERPRAPIQPASLSSSPERLAGQGALRTSCPPRGTGRNAPTPTWKPS